MSFDAWLLRVVCICVKVARRLNLVYGGGSVGLMGLVSQAVHQAGGHVLGYIYIYIYMDTHTHKRKGKHIWV